MDVVLRFRPELPGRVVRVRGDEAPIVAASAAMAGQRDTYCTLRKPSTDVLAGRRGSTAKPRFWRIAKHWA